MRNPAAKFAPFCDNPPQMGNHAGVQSGVIGIGCRRLVQHDNVDPAERLAHQAKVFADDALEPVPLHRVPGVAARYRQSEPSRRLVAVVRAKRKVLVVAAVAAIKDLFELLRLEQAAGLAEWRRARG